MNINLIAYVESNKKLWLKIQNIFLRTESQKVWLLTLLLTQFILKSKISQFYFYIHHSIYSFSKQKNTNISAWIPINYSFVIQMFFSKIKNSGAQKHPKTKNITNNSWKVYTHTQNSLFVFGSELKNKLKNPTRKFNISLHQNSFFFEMRVFFCFGDI